MIANSLLFPSPKQAVRIKLARELLNRIQHPINCSRRCYKQFHILSFFLPSLFDLSTLHGDTSADSALFLYPSLSRVVFATLIPTQKVNQSNSLLQCLGSTTSFCRESPTLCQSGYAVLRRDLQLRIPPNHHITAGGVRILISDYSWKHIHC